MHNSIQKLALCLLGIQSALVSAVPDVTVVPLTTSNCSPYPNWQGGAGVDVTGTVFIQLDQSDNTTANGLYSSVFPAAGPNTEKTIISITPQKDLAKIGYKCFNGVFQDNYVDGESVPHISANISDPQYGYFGYWGGGWSPAPYAHQIDGQQQDGVFLGATGLTTWGFTYHPAGSGAGELEHFEARLLFPDVKPRDCEFEGFLKIVGFIS
jgi:hypothetical protein